jgi:hypothetical protein
MGLYSSYSTGIASIALFEKPKRIMEATVISRIMQRDDNVAIVREFMEIGLNELTC